MNLIDEKPEARDEMVSKPDDFEEMLVRAENLYQNSDYEEALSLLSVLQERYLGVTRLFDLMGEILLKKGDLIAGVRYRTLFEVLTSTLKSQTGTTSAEAVVESEEPIESDEPEATFGSQECDQSELIEEDAAPDADSLPETHVTAAMGRQLMEQGHYEQALSVFDALLTKDPDDEDVIELRESARRRGRERRVVGILERWLHNIDRVKMDRSKDA